MWSFRGPSGGKLAILPGISSNHQTQCMHFQLNLAPGLASSMEALVILQTRGNYFHYSLSKSLNPIIHKQKNCFGTLKFARTCGHHNCKRDADTQGSRKSAISNLFYGIGLVSYIIFWISLCSELVISFPCGILILSINSFVLLNVSYFLIF